MCLRFGIATSVPRMVRAYAVRPTEPDNPTTRQAYRSVGHCVMTTTNDQRTACACVVSHCVSHCAACRIASSLDASHFASHFALRHCVLRCVRTSLDASHDVRACDVPAVPPHCVRLCVCVSRACVCVSLPAGGVLVGGGGVGAPQTFMRAPSGGGS